MCLYGLSQGDQSTAFPKMSCCHSTTRIRTVPMRTSSAWLSCEPCDVRVGMYIVFAYGIEHAYAEEWKCKLEEMCSGPKKCKRDEMEQHEPGDAAGGQIISGLKVVASVYDACKDSFVAADEQ